MLRHCVIARKPEGLTWQSRLSFEQVLGSESGLPHRQRTRATARNDTSILFYTLSHTHLITTEFPVTIIRIPEENHWNRCLNCSGSF
jgi:hypothetical protein